ncbi:MAG: hypothetical protein M1457_08515 [bacterium]|nr:hypothetical protein [bacterium]
MTAPAAHHVVPDNLRDYRVSRENPCGICGKHDWCLCQPGVWAICQRVESEHRWGEAGWFHRLDGNEHTNRRPATRPLPSTPKSYHRPQAEPSAIYHYNTPYGDPHYRKLRYNKGVLNPERKVCLFEVYRDGEWIGGRGCMTGVERVIYRVEQIPFYDSIFVVEGEKCCDLLWDFGILAVCNDDGAKHWRREYSQALAGKVVTILPDNDPDGRAHADLVARSLFGIAKSIKIVSLPGLGLKGDVYDWIMASGGSIS